MRLLEQARSRISSAVNDSKSTPIDQQRSESSNTPPVEQQKQSKLCQIFKKPFLAYLILPVEGKFKHTYQHQDQVKPAPVHSDNRVVSPHHMCAINTWKHDFICLASTNMEETPTSIHLQNLRRAGLGRKKIVFKNKNGDQNHIRQQHLNIFLQISTSCLPVCCQLVLFANFSFVIPQTKTTLLSSVFLVNNIASQQRSQTKMKRTLVYLVYYHVVVVESKVLYEIKSYNHFHNILRLFDVLTNFPFIASETIHNYYL